MAKKPVLYNAHASEEVYRIVRQAVPDDVELLTLETPDEDEKIRKIADCEVVIQASMSFPRALVEAGTKLRLLLHEGVGYQDTVDVVALKEHGVRLTVTPEGTVISVAEHTVMMMIGVFKHVVYSHNELVAGRFHRLTLRPTSRQLYGATIGYVGMGRIGQAVAERLVGFKTTGLYTDPVRLTSERESALGLRAASLDEVLANSDVVTIHTPLTPQTRGMIGAAQIAAMRPDAILVCTARGGIIDEAALSDAVKGGHLLGIGLDVFGKEPLPAGDALTTLPNAILTPHSAGSTADAVRMKMAALFANYRRFYAGEPLQNEITL